MHKEPIHISDATFEKAVLKSDTLVLVDFWAPWCGPCRAVAPTLEKLADEYAGKMLVAKINTDDDSDYAMQYNVRGIPTLLFVRDGEEVDRIVGAAPYPMIKEKIDSVLAAV